MKRLYFFLILLILLQPLIAHELTQGQTKTIEDREITAISLKQSKAVMQVGTEKNIISLGQEKEINGVRIEIVDILYTGDDDSIVTFNTELTYSCGDLICDPSETPETCCQDCACSIGKQCTSNGCIQPQCFLDEDCNDSKELTKDTCENYKCKHKSIACDKDTQCNDNNPDTDDFCITGECQNLPPICTTDEDCLDDNPCTLDQCINRDCQYNSVQNCTTKKTETKEKPESPSEETIIKMTRDSDPNFFQSFINWIKNLF
jgi:hypothetical protein